MTTYKTEIGYSRTSARKKVSKITPLTRAELVHHIDGNPLNNDIRNLAVLTTREHSKIHNEMAQGSSRKKYFEPYLPRQTQKIKVEALPTFQEIEKNKYDKINILCMVCHKDVAIFNYQIFDGVNTFNTCVCECCSDLSVKNILNKIKKNP